MLNVVLVEPEIPANTGNIGRTCVLANARLHLVGPLGFDLSDKSIQRAGLALYFEGLASFADKLLNCGHKWVLINILCFPAQKSGTTKVVIIFQLTSTPT